MLLHALCGFIPSPHLAPLTCQTWQDAQLSQRDRAAGCVMVIAKSGRLELGNNILQTL